jgi:hypothetical protein
MTLVSDIITRAYRESNLVPLGVDPNANQISEALAHFNPIVMSTIGNEVGDDLKDINISSGTYDQSTLISNWVPDSARLLLDVTAAQTITLDPFPEDGQRFAVVDLGNNLATYNVTLDGNGRNIESAATLVLNTNGLTREWFYRADLGNWVRVATLATTDEMPFPSEFDPYFEIMLAMRLNPHYGQSLAPETVKTLVRAKSKMNARYGQTTEVLPDVNWRNIPSQSKYWSAYSDDSFNTGRPYWWK